MTSDDPAALVALRDVPTEVVPSIALVTSLDQVPFGASEVRKEHGEQREQGARLEVEILYRGLLVGVEGVKAD